jgi:hypothetical protein
MSDAFGMSNNLGIAFCEFPVFKERFALVERADDFRRRN